MHGVVKHTSIRLGVRVHPSLSRAIPDRCCTDRSVRLLELSVPRDLQLGRCHVAQQQQQLCHPTALEHTPRFQVRPDYRYCCTGRFVEDTPVLQVTDSSFLTRVPVLESTSVVGRIVRSHIEAFAVERHFCWLYVRERTRTYLSTHSLHAYAYYLRITEGILDMSTTKYFMVPDSSSSLAVFIISQSLV